MKKIALILFISSLYFIISCGSDSSGDDSTGVDDTNVRLQELPDVDFSEKDLSLQNKKRFMDGSIGAMSPGACSAKTLRNKALYYARKVQYVADLIAALEKGSDKFRIEDGETAYFEIPTFNAGPFGTISRMKVRFQEKDGKLYVDAISGLSGQQETRDIQLQMPDGENSGLLTLIVSFADPDNTNNYEKIRADVDTTIENHYNVQLQIKGHGEVAEGEYNKYVYIFSFTSDEREESAPFNISSGKFGEDFTNTSENFWYTMAEWNKFNSEKGTTVAAHGKPADTANPQIQSWKATDNTIIDSSDSPYYTEAQEVELEEFTFEQMENMQVNFTDEGSGWDGSTEGNDYVSITSPIDMPEYEEWPGYDDVTTCTEGSAALEAQKDEIDLM
ncbi:MAG: hypothetical protein JXK07_05260 [Spirochaetes bacterium]|nr:hypothetical protein [Spirochaetota bacterium]MBN2769337.1 hypothetical protein [Spirochaetota bacterium]